MNRHRLLAVVLAASAAGTPAAAKPPTLDRLFPAGAQRGRTAAVTASGSFDHWPVGGWADEPGIAVTADKEKGKLAIAVAHDVRPGLPWVRLYDDGGATALRPWIVGSLPEMIEVETSQGAIAVEGPGATINGRLGRRGDV